MAQTFLKLKRSFGQWTELRDERTGTVSQVRVVRCADDPDAVQMEFKAPPEVRIERVSAVGAGMGGRRA